MNFRVILINFRSILIKFRVILEGIKMTILNLDRFDRWWFDDFPDGFDLFICLNLLIVFNLLL